MPLSTSGSCQFIPVSSFTRRNLPTGSTKYLADLPSSVDRTSDTSQLKENVVAVDATYYLSRMLKEEPLVTALGGLLAAEKTVNDDLDKWQANDTTPFFIFDGCPVKGEDDLAAKTGREANLGSDAAWSLYANGEAMSAVQGFGGYSGMTPSPSSLGSAPNDGLRRIQSTVTLSFPAIHFEEAGSSFPGTPVQSRFTGE